MSFDITDTVAPGIERAIAREIDRGKLSIENIIGQLAPDGESSSSTEPTPQQGAAEAAVAWLVARERISLGRVLQKVLEIEAGDNLGLV